MRLFPFFVSEEDSVILYSSKDRLLAKSDCWAQRGVMPYSSPTVFLVGAFARPCHNQSLTGKKADVRGQWGDPVLEVWGDLRIISRQCFAVPFTIPVPVWGKGEGGREGGEEGMVHRDRGNVWRWNRYSRNTLPHHQFAIHLKYFMRK